MHTRWLIGLVLSIITVPILVLGLFDPLEGGLALMLAGVFIIITWAVSRVPVPRLEWIAWLVSVGTGIAAIVAAVLVRNAQGLPVGGAAGLPAWVWVLAIAYELSVLVTIAGGVQYVVSHARTLHHPTPALPH